jgi:hypothetical protein
MLFFVWKELESEIFSAVATDDCLCLVDDCAQFLRLKTRMDALFDMNLQKGATLRFLNLRVIQSHQGISIEQIDHNVNTIIDTYFVNRDVSKLVPLANPFPTESPFERDLRDSPIIMGSQIHAIEK